MYHVDRKKVSAHTRSSSLPDRSKLMGEFLPTSKHSFVNEDRSPIVHLIPHNKQKVIHDIFYEILW